MKSPAWHTLSTEQAVKQLDTNIETGLTHVEAKKRLTEYGLNELKETGAKNPWKIVWEQCSAIMVVILIIAAGVSLFLGEVVDGIAIGVIIILNVVLGFVQEYRAERAIAALKKLSVPKVRVMRGGESIEIPARKLVPGDIVLLEAGVRLSADGRLVDCAALRIDESALTGESEPAEKSVDACAGEHLPLGDQDNMAFMGTAVTYGRGAAVVVSTGMNTQLGIIADRIQQVERKQTVLQIKLAQLARGLALAAFGIVCIVFVMGLFRQEDIRTMIMTAISMAVAAVPEGLPAVVTIALALGAQRMLKRNALIRRLTAVETLGSSTVICSDKTGTLTENSMQVTVLDIAGRRVDVPGLVAGKREVSISEESEQNIDRDELEVLSLLLGAGALCNDASIASVKPNKNVRVIGDPTEAAIVLCAVEAGLNKTILDTALPRIGEVPFSSERKRMSTVHSFENQPEGEAKRFFESLDAAPSASLVFSKGAVNELLPCCSHVRDDDTVVDMNDDYHSRIIAANDDLAGNGIRVLGVAYRILDSVPAEDDFVEETIEKDLVFVGMVGMLDPPRAEVRQSVHVCKEAGIRPVMITGDHPLTASYIARQLGITENDKVVTGQELAVMTKEQLDESVKDVSVYARVSPEHKLIIVNALQDQGNVVAMTGDGVNDAPALKTADIGVAMGITGTDVAKEAADTVLLDDNFATIVAAVQEGRVIYDNIRKFIRYILTTNAGELIVMLAFPFLGMPLPLLPLQILWINLVTDGLPALALGVEPAEADTMQRPPRNPHEHVFARGLGWHVLIIGFVCGAVSLGTGWWYFRAGNPCWQTMTFTSLTFTAFTLAYGHRTEFRSIFRVPFFANKMMFLSLTATLLLQMAVIYIPACQKVFKTVSLSFSELGVAITAGIVALVASELLKPFLRTKNPEPNPRSGALQS